MSVKTNLASIHKNIPPNVKLVCVSKFHTKEEIMEAYIAGERIFGENKVQELCSKYETLPSDIQWHFIGHLQTNKVKFIVPFVSMIHGVDSLKLMNEIDKAAAKIDKKVRCLLQIHIALEESKFGFSEAELFEAIKSGEIDRCKNVEICGVMGMATFTNDLIRVRTEFRTLKRIFNKLKTEHFAQNVAFTEISMGMTDDYHIAIEEGSTIVRIGTAIFGVRNYI